MGSMQGKARPSTEGMWGVCFFGFLGVMINHVCCRGYGVFTVVVSRIDNTFLSRWKI